MERGEIWHCDLSPAAAREQKGPHYVLIVSPGTFNKGGVPLVCPITTVGNSSRMRGFTVNLSGAGTGVTGVIQSFKLPIVGPRHDRAARPSERRSSARFHHG